MARKARPKQTPSVLRTPFGFEEITPHGARRASPDALRGKIGDSKLRQLGYDPHSPEATRARKRRLKR